MNRIREIRKQKGLTQSQLANLLGSNQGVIQKIEKGITNLTVDWMRKISQALKCEPWELLPFDMQPKTFLFCGSLNELKKIIKDIEQ